MQGSCRFVVLGYSNMSNFDDARLHLVNIKQKKIRMLKTLWSDRVPVLSHSYARRPMDVPDMYPSRQPERTKADNHVTIQYGILANCYGCIQDCNRRSTLVRPHQGQMNMVAWKFGYIVWNRKDNGQAAITSCHERDIPNDVWYRTDSPSVRFYFRLASIARFWLVFFFL